MVPRLTRVGLLQNPDNSSYDAVLKSTRAAAQKAGMAIVPVDASDPQQIEEAFAAFVKERVQAVKVSPDTLFLRFPKMLAELALAQRLPAIFPQIDYVKAGGLMSYGESLFEFYRSA